MVLEAGQEPVQKVVPLDAFKLRLVRMDALKERDREAQALQWMQQENRRPFVLTQVPLPRAVLLRPEPERHLLGSGWRGII